MGRRFPQMNADKTEGFKKQNRGGKNPKLRSFPCHTFGIPASVFYFFLYPENPRLSASHSPWKGNYAKAVHRGSILQGLRNLHRVLSGQDS
jgi:hypothetical protein